jgi:hypothetical protein
VRDLKHTLDRGETVDVLALLDGSITKSGREETNVVGFLLREGNETLSNFVGVTSLLEVGSRELLESCREMTTRRRRD